MFILCSFIKQTEIFVKMPNTEKQSSISDAAFSLSLNLGEHGCQATSNKTDVIKTVRDGYHLDFIRKGFEVKPAAIETS